MLFKEVRFVSVSVGIRYVFYNFDLNYSWAASKGYSTSTLWIYYVLYFLSFKIIKLFGAVKK